MSEPSSRRIRAQHIVAPPDDPAEHEAMDARRRAYKKTAMGQVGCLMVVDAPLPLLAQVIAELSPDEQQLFLKELLDRLPAAALPQLEEALRGRQRAASA
jgi:hypothetical protein